MIFKVRPPGDRETYVFQIGTKRWALICFRKPSGFEAPVASRTRRRCPPLRGRGDPDPVRSAFLPAVGRPQQQGLAACAAVGGRVAAVDWGRHGVLLLPCREPGEPGESAEGWGCGAAGGVGWGLGPQAVQGARGPGCRGRAERRVSRSQRAKLLPLPSFLSSHRTEHGKRPSGHSQCRRNGANILGSGRKQSFLLRLGYF